jgi:uncharacterized protein (DUF58 family)
MTTAAGGRTEIGFGLRVVAALGLAGVVVGVLLRWPELIGASVGLLAMLLTLLVVRGPVRAEWWDVSAPVRVTRGDPAELVIGVAVTGSGRWVSAVAPDSGGRAWVTSSSSSASSSSSLLTWPIDTTRRGLVPVGPERLEFADPFGLVRRTLATRTSTDVLVVPRVSPAPVLRPASFRDDGMDGERPGSEQFHSLREYVVGDPLKMVHWRSSARTGTLMVRRMVDTTVPWLVIALDVDPLSYNRPGALFFDFDPAAFEAAVDAAASWAWANCTTDQRVLLTTTALDSPTVEVTLRSRESALDWLALVEAGEPGCSHAGRIGAVARKRAAGRIVLVTGAAAETVGLVAQWSRLAQVTVVRPE